MISDGFKQHNSRALHARTHTHESSFQSVFLISFPLTNFATFIRCSFVDFVAFPHGRTHRHTHGRRPLDAINRQIYLKLLGNKHTPNRLYVQCHLVVAFKIFICNRGHAIRPCKSCLEHVTKMDSG